MTDLPQVPVTPFMEEPESKGKSFLAGFGAGILLVLLPALAIEFYFHCQVSTFFKNPPSVMDQKTVEDETTVGKGLFQKSVFLEDPQLGQVTDIEPGAWGYPESEVKLAIVGQAEALFTDETGAAKSTIRFEKSALGKAQLLKIPGQADCEFIFRGNWSEDAALVDHQGKVVWTYGHSVTHVAVDDMGAGVLGSDGKLFFAVGFNGKGSLDLLDANGQKQWSEPGDDIWHVEIADAKGDGNPVILHTDVKGELTIRDKNGAVLNQAKPDSEFCTHFTLCHWPNNASPLYVLCSTAEKLWIMDFYGKAVTTLSAPDCTGMGTALGVPCQLKAGEPDYFAAVVYLKGLMTGSVIYIFDPSGKVVYQETLSEPLESIAALPSVNGGAGTLLIGGENRIWKYSLQGP